MRRTQRRAQRTQRTIITRSKKNNQSQLNHTVLSPRHTRSKSKKTSEIQKQSTSKGHLPQYLQINKENQSKSEHTVSSPKRTRSCTRSKSQKIIEIQKSSVFSEHLPQNVAIETENQSKSFVKLNNFKIDSIVLAKQKYSWPWPSQILAIEKERTLVYFFGDKRSGFVQNTEIYDFILSANAIKLKLLSKKIPCAFSTGILEVERLLGIPRDQSLLN